MFLAQFLFYIVMNNYYNKKILKKFIYKNFVIGIGYMENYSYLCITEV